jgi:hypothetical protein
MKKKIALLNPKNSPLASLLKNSVRVYVASFWFSPDEESEDIRILVGTYNSCMGCRIEPWYIYPHLLEAYTKTRQN